MKYNSSDLTTRLATLLPDFAFTYVSPNGIRVEIKRLNVHAWETTIVATSIGMPTSSTRWVTTFEGTKELRTVIIGMVHSLEIVADYSTCSDTES